MLGMIADETLNAEQKAEGREDRKMIANSFLKNRNSGASLQDDSGSPALTEIRTAQNSGRMRAGRPAGFWRDDGCKPRCGKEVWGIVRK